MPTHSTEALIPHLPAMRRRAMQLTRNRADADDLVSDTVLRAIRSWDSFDGVNLRAYLNAIMKRRYLDTTRNARRRPSVDLETAHRALFSADDQHAALEAKQACEALRGLPDNHYAVMVAAASGLSERKISDELGIDRKVLRRRTKAAREALHQYA